MPYLLSTVLAGLIILSSQVTLNFFSWQRQPLAAIPIISDFFKSSVPDNLGLKNGQLSACPSSPNCVNSLDKSDVHGIKPLVYQTNLEKAKETLLKVLAEVPRTEVIEQKDNYIWAQSTSRILGFVDDLEFYFPPEQKIIQVRSASRVGEGDLGVNRRRLEQIRLALLEMGI